MKCRQTGIVAEIYQRMGMQTVNMPGGEIVPSAQRGVIDCAEWVGGIEDLRLGLPQVWKYHYTPGMHETIRSLELIINSEVWKSFTPQQQEAVACRVTDTFVRWWVKWQKQRRRDRGDAHQARHADAAHAARHADRFFKTWDKIARRSRRRTRSSRRCRLAARIRVEGGTGETLHVPAVLVRGELLLPEKMPAAAAKGKEKSK